MSDMHIFDTKMTAIADEIRELTETEGLLTLDDMKTWLSEVGNNVDTSDATASADEIFEGETAYVNGEKVTGNFTINEELTAQDDLIAQIQTALEGKMAVAPADPDLQSKTVTPDTSAQTVEPDAGYDGLSSVTVGAIPDTYVTPTATKTATTYTPTTSNQTIAAGTYCSGVQTIKGDANLVSENIKSGVSIFGVNGSYEGGSGGGGTTMATIGVSASYGTEIKYIDASGNLATISNASGNYSLPVPRLYFANLPYGGYLSNIDASGNCSIIFQGMSQVVFYAIGDGYICANGSNTGGGGN